jgi:hypothetical protein
MSDGKKKSRTIIFSVITMEPETRVEKCQKLSRWFSNSRSGSRTVKCDEQEPRFEYLRHKTNTTLPIETTWDQREREKKENHVAAYKVRYYSTNGYGAVTVV